MVLLDRADKFSSLPVIERCFKFIDEVNEKNLPNGRYELEDGIYCGISESVIANRDEFFYEAHRKKADIHCILNGRQSMLIGFADQMEISEYTEEKDFVKIFGEHHSEVVLKPGSALLLFPNDAHTVTPDKFIGESIRKIIFKIPMSLF